jgi:hypothetical protein
VERLLSHFEPLTRSEKQIFRWYSVFARSVARHFKLNSVRNWLSLRGLYRSDELLLGEKEQLEVDKQLLLQDYTSPFCQLKEVALAPLEMRQKKMHILMTVCKLEELPSSFSDFVAILVDYSNKKDKIKLQRSSFERLGTCDFTVSPQVQNAGDDLPLVRSVIPVQHQNTLPDCPIANLANNFVKFFDNPAPLVDLFRTKSIKLKISEYCVKNRSNFQNFVPQRILIFGLNIS